MGNTCRTRVAELECGDYAMQGSNHITAIFAIAPVFIFVLTYFFSRFVLFFFLISSIYSYCCPELGHCINSSNSILSVFLLGYGSWCLIRWFPIHFWWCMMMLSMLFEILLVIDRSASGNCYPFNQCRTAKVQSMSYLKIWPYSCLVS